MNQIDFNKTTLKVKGLVKENWGSPILIGFMLLLFTAAVALYEGMFSLADSVAVYAYYALVAGLFLQLACFLKYRRKSDDEVPV